MNKLLIYVLLIVVLIITSIFIWEKHKKSGTDAEVSHSMIVTNIEQMGKLEVVKYTVENVVEYKKVRQWLPNSKTLLIVVGEVVGCIDFSKIKPEDIQVQKDSIHLSLPAPEICYCKVDHQRSRVYNVEFGLWDTHALVDEAYRHAESQLYVEANRMGINTDSQSNAIKMLTPMLNAMGFKKVAIQFKFPDKKQLD